MRSRRRRCAPLSRHHYALWTLSHCTMPCLPDGVLDGHLHLACSSGGLLLQLPCEHGSAGRLLQSRGGGRGGIMRNRVTGCAANRPRWGCSCTYHCGPTNEAACAAQFSPAGCAGWRLHIAGCGPDTERWPYIADSAPPHAQGSRGLARQLVQWPRLAAMPAEAAAPRGGCCLHGPPAPLPVPRCPLPLRSPPRPC